MIGVVVPAHNEEKWIAACVQSIFRAAQCAHLQTEGVTVLVVCDNCSDGTEQRALAAGARVAQLTAGNVGQARGLGASLLLAAGARWLAFTDADSCVAPTWLSAQLALGADAVCGTIAVNQWSGYGARLRRHFAANYTDRDGHRHIHGANLGVSAEAYQRAGGFQALATSEDVALVKALIGSGARIAWSAAPRVTTSARRDFRAPGGFGATLQRMEQQRAWSGSVGVGASTS